MDEGSQDIATLLAEAMEVTSKKNGDGSLLVMQGGPRRTQSWSPGLDYTPPAPMTTKQKVHASAKKWGDRLGYVGMGATGASMLPGPHIPGTAVTAGLSYAAAGACKGIEYATGNCRRPTAAQGGSMATGVASVAGAIPHPIPQAIGAAA